MIVDIQIYNGEKEIFGRKDMDYDTSLGWLFEKQEKGKEIDEISIQVYTAEEMPIDSFIGANWDQARQFIKDVANNARDGKYRGIRYETNSTKIEETNSQRSFL
jgi:hypothetical protein